MMENKCQVPSEVKSIHFKFFLQGRILLATFRFEKLIIIRIGPLLSNQWQSSIFEESVSTSSFLKIFKVAPPDFVAQFYKGQLLDILSSIVLLITSAPTFQRNYMIFQFFMDMPSNAKFWLQLNVVLLQIWKILS